MHKTSDGKENTGVQLNVTKWWFFQGVPNLSACDSQDRLHVLHNLYSGKWKKIDEWEVDIFTCNYL